MVFISWHWVSFNSYEMAVIRGSGQKHLKLAKPQWQEQFLEYIVGSVNLY